MLISCFSLSSGFFVFLSKRCRDMNFFLRSKQLTGGVIWRALILIVEFPSRIVYDECTGACQC